MQLLTVEEMANHIRSTVGTVYAWVSMRRIPDPCVVKLGRKLLFDLTEVDKWLASCKAGRNPLMSAT